MTFRNKAQARRLCQAIRQKARKLCWEWNGAYTILTTSDVIAIEKIVDRAEKRLK